MSFWFPIWGGTHAKGWTIAESEEEAQRIKDTLKEYDLRVTIRRKYETFKGERLLAIPYRAKVSWDATLR